MRCSHAAFWPARSWQDRRCSYPVSFTASALSILVMSHRHFASAPRVSWTLRRVYGDEGDTRRSARQDTPMRTDPVEGVLLLAHGSIDTLDEVPDFLLKIRHGRPPSEALIAETRRRYTAIGGRSPLLERTQTQAKSLARRLGRPVLVGM